MDLHLHANATRTPQIRAYIQQSTASHLGLARELGISVDNTKAEMLTSLGLAY